MNYLVVNMVHRLSPVLPLLRFCGQSSVARPVRGQIPSGTISV